MNTAHHPGALTWSELVAQPDAWTALLKRMEQPAEFPRIDLDSFDEILLVGCGTSYYLALAAADWIKRRNGVPVRAVPACEIMLDDYETTRPPARRLAIGFSRSGESSELILAIEALKRIGYAILSVGCTAGSSLMRLGDHRILVHEGHEDGMVMLRSFTSMLLSIQMLFGSPADRPALAQLPDIGRNILAHREAELRALARQRSFNRFVFLASGSSYPIAVEAGLKMQEMAIATSETYHSLEYRHGPKATADQDTLVTLFAPSDRHHGRALARDLKALGVTLVVVGPGAEVYVDIADLVVPVPDGLSEGQASVLSLLPIQVMAYETAMRRGRNPDAPANLSKVVIFPS
jgi:glucosamine--fructose-6-phosphate aminotransferase (isomerizing)